MTLTSKQSRVPINSAWIRQPAANGRKGKEIHWEFTVPDNTVATILLPPCEVLEFLGTQELKHDDSGNLLALPGEYTLRLK